MYTGNRVNMVPDVSAEKPSLSLKLSPLLAASVATTSIWSNTICNENSNWCKIITMLKCCESDFYFITKYFTTCTLKIQVARIPSFY